VVETEHEAVGFVYQGQIDVLLNSDSRGGFFLNNPLELSYGHVSVAIRVLGVLSSVVSNVISSWLSEYPSRLVHGVP